MIAMAERCEELFNSPEAKVVLQDIGSIALEITSLVEKYAGTSLKSTSF